MHTQNIIERAFELARGSDNIDAIRKVLRREGYSNVDAHLGGASIKADLVAQTIIISGAVTGNVKANVKVELRATGSVTGDIAAPLLLMAEGAVIMGGVDVKGKAR